MGYLDRAKRKIKVLLTSSDAYVTIRWKGGKIGLPTKKNVLGVLALMYDAGVLF